MAGNSHELKTWPGPFAAILDGAKRHEVRRQDRSFSVGDTLVLREWDPVKRSVWHGGPPGTTIGGRFEVTEPHYTGREIRVRVTYLTSGGEWGLPKDVCVMSIEQWNP